MTSWSSRGVTQDGCVKPGIPAPGLNTAMTGTANSGLTPNKPDRPGDRPDRLQPGELESRELVPGLLVDQLRQAALP